MEQTPRRLSDAERLDWLRLIRSDNVGPVTFRQLLRACGSAAHALEQLPGLARRGGRRVPCRICPTATAERELARLAAIGGLAVASCEPAYPAALRAVDDAPPMIAVRGRAELFSAERQVAVVGARNASANGRRFAGDVSRDLSAAGFVVVSGLARGIDGAAHLGALGGIGGTTAVLAGGIDVIYPPEHAQLYQRVAAEGLVVGELPLGTEPQARYFPRRNRIISGLTRGTVVVEAALRSGSLITARFANEQGREVMAVPGSPFDPRCQGTNQLIRQGATLVGSAEEVLEVIDRTIILRQYSNHPQNNIDQSIDFAEEYESPAARTEILTLLGASPVEVDELLRQCHCSAPVMGMVLLELDLAGRLERHTGNRVSLLAGCA